MPVSEKKKASLHRMQMFLVFYCRELNFWNKSNSHLFLLLLFPRLALFQIHSVTAGYSAFLILSRFSRASVCKSYSYSQKFLSGADNITTGLSSAIVQSAALSLSPCLGVCIVNITEWVLAWPHQYNMDRGLEIQHCTPSPPAMTYGEEDWLAVCSDDTCLHRMYRK